MNKRVKTRKDHACIVCGKTIQKGEFADYDTGWVFSCYSHIYPCLDDFSKEEIKQIYPNKRPEQEAGENGE